jgi:hypothetical protein
MKMFAIANWDSRDCRSRLLHLAMAFMKVTEPNHAFIVARIYISSKRLVHSDPPGTQPICSIGDCEVVCFFCSYVSCVYLPWAEHTTKMRKNHCFFWEENDQHMVCFLFTSMLVYTSVDIANSSIFIIFWS